MGRKSDAINAKPCLPTTMRGTLAYALAIILLAIGAMAVDLAQDVDDVAS